MSQKNIATIKCRKKLMAYTLKTATFPFRTQVSSTT